ncbi:uncharacterized protein METZ01_LOCUS132868, partial [marine metagenome]
MPFNAAATTIANITASTPMISSGHSPLDPPRTM